MTTRYRSSILHKKDNNFSFFDQFDAKCIRRTHEIMKTNQAVKNVYFWDILNDKIWILITRRASPNSVHWFDKIMGFNSSQDNSLQCLWRSTPSKTLEHTINNTGQFLLTCNFNTSLCSKVPVCYTRSKSKFNQCKPNCHCTGMALASSKDLISAVTQV